MKFSDLFILSTRMFKARPSRTFLTILGMSVGIGAILFLVSMGYGLQNTLLEKITTSDSLLTLDVTPNKSQNAFLDEASIQKIEEIEGVDDISPSYQIDARGSMEDLSTDLSATVVNPTYLKLGGVEASTGELLNDDEINGIVISVPIVKIFRMEPKDIIGKSMVFSFTVKKENGVEEKYVPSSDFKIIGVLEAEDNTIYINSKALSEIPVPVFSQIKVKCRENGIMPQIQDTIGKMGFSVSSISDTVDQANKIFRVIKIVLMLFGFIALVVSAIGMFNTMTITLLERTEEIGIMKSIGASDYMISMMFIMEATIMGFLGGLVGIIIGLIEGNVFNIMINLIATHFGGQKVDLFYSPSWFIMSIIIFSAVVGFATGVIPARRASKIDPLEALRYK